MNDEVGKVVARTGRGEPISVEANAKPWYADTTTDDADDTEDVFCLSDVFGKADTEDLADTLDRAERKAEEAQRRRDTEQLDALRKQLTPAITAGRFSELAIGGYGPSSPIASFFKGDDSE
jgi:hypothetical protein